MKTCTTRNKSRKYTLISFGIVILVWKVLTFCFSPLVLPTISSVVKAIFAILTDVSLLSMVGITVGRLTLGLGIGVALGLIVGISMGISQKVKDISYPIIHLFQTIPPVSWVVLALVWFGFNGKPAIFIVIVSTIPVITINVCEGITNVDNKLLQMADLYQFSQKKKFQFIIIPSILPYFNSAFKVALGGGWKIAVMGEVLTTGDGIGGMIKLARLNLEPDYIIAWSIIIVMLFYLSDFIVAILKKGRNQNAKS